jgi:glycosyltransferase involved in cell wall biosynthesis
MRIAIDTLSFVPGKRGFGGGERYLTNLISSLQRIDEENEYLILVSKDNQGAFQLLQPNFTKVNCPSYVTSVFSRVLYEQFVLPFWLKNHQVDVVHFPANMLSVLTNTPTVLTVHDLLMRFYSRVWPQSVPLLKRVLTSAAVELSARRATEVITISEFTRRELVRYTGIESSRIHVVYHGVASLPKPTRRDSDVLHDYDLIERYILAVGTLNRHKNYGILLKAFVSLKSLPAFKKLKLVFVGRPGIDYDSFRAIVEESEYRSDVVIAGFVPSGELTSLYRNAAVFVQPSRYEGFGFPVLEAMSCGTPVIAADAASLPELVGDAGLLFSPSNTEELKEKLRILLTDENQREQFVLRGRERVKTFTWETMAEQVLYSYRQAV